MYRHPVELQERIQREHLLATIALRIRQSLDLDEILNTTVAEVRQFLQTDRVLLYRFEPDWSGVVTVESVDARWPCVLGTKIEDSCFQETYVEPYKYGRIKAIDDIYTRELAQCHIDLLAQFKVRANLVVPVLQGKKLWGLLIAHHCCTPRQWEQSEIDLLEQLATQVAIAIQQSELYQQVQTELIERQRTEAALQQAKEELELRVEERTAALKQINQQLKSEVAERRRAEEELQRQNLRSQLFAEITLKIRQSLQLEDILQTTVTEVRELLQVDRVLVYRLESDGSGTAVTEAVNPGWPVILKKTFPAEVFPKEYHEQYRLGRVRAVEDVEKNIISPCLIEFVQQFGVKAKLVVPLIQREELWGLLVAHHCVSPRAWSDFEISLLQQLANQVGIALAQAQLLEALRESEQKYRSVVDNVSEVIFQTNAAGSWTFLNPAWTEITGFTLNASIGKNFLEFVHPDDRQSNLELFQPLIKRQKDYCRYETRYLTKEGGFRWIEVHARLTLASDGTIIGTSGILNDVTKRKQVEAEIRKALETAKELSDLKSSFITMTSHEFRTPLSIISSSAGLLKDYSHKLDEAKKLKHLQRIQSTVIYMTQLLEDVLLINRAEAGRLEFNSSPLDLMEFCSGLVEELQLGIHTNHTIALRTACDTYLTKNADMDEKLLRQILSNLLSNAIKYSAPGSKVHFDIACQNTVVVFQIKDEGIGITPEDQVHLFESFHRGKNVGNISGTGLGLAIVKKCVELHRGQIAVASVVGVGTTFTVTLPLNNLIKGELGIGNGELGIGKS